MVNPHQVTKDFEQALCDYTGAPYAVATTSCTMALFLACKWQFEQLGSRAHKLNFKVTIPSRTYISVPMSILHAGFNDVHFVDVNWEGFYGLGLLPIVDSARLFTSDMYDFFEGQFVCCSFHWSKTLAIGQGGCILHSNAEADKWFRRARFDGRTEGVPPNKDNFDMLGYHAYMSPRDAADGLSRLAVLPRNNDPLPNDDYPDLSQFEIFK